MTRHNFKKLEVWHLAMDVVDDIYNITQHFPKEELFGLSLQMRKSAVSIPSNIAEGCGRNSDPQLLHFTDIAQGSAFELETQIYISKRRGFCLSDESQKVAKKVISVQKMIDGFQDKIRNDT